MLWENRSQRRRVVSAKLHLHEAQLFPITATPEDREERRAAAVLEEKPMPVFHPPDFSQPPPPVPPQNVSHAHGHGQAARPRKWLSLLSSQKRKPAESSEFQSCFSLQPAAIRAPEPGCETVLSAPPSSIRTSSPSGNGRLELRLRGAPSRPSFRTSKWAWRYRISSSLRTNAASKRRLSSSATVFRRRRCRLSAASGLRFACHRRRLPASTLRGD